MILLEALWAKGSRVIHKSSVWRQLTLLTVLAFPATASAAPFGELPFQRVATGTGCLAPTGAPGELSRSVDVSPRGDAVVAWAELSWALPRVHVRVARREAGGAFGAPVDVVPWRSERITVGVLAGMAADGEAVLYVRGASGGHTVRIVAPDGRALLAGSTGGGVGVLERPAGGAFGAPQTPTEPDLPVNAEQAAVAFGDGGRAVVAWYDDDDGFTGAAVRGAATGFATVNIVPRARRPRRRPPRRG